VAVLAVMTLVHYLGALVEPAGALANLLS